MADDQELKSAQAESNFWQTQLELASQNDADWTKEGERVVDRYRNEKKSKEARKFNILWSNTETLKAALYGKTAKPDIRRRYLDADPDGRQVSEVLERALSYCEDQYDFDTPITAGLEDHLLPGRGVIRVKYDPEIKQKPQLDPMTLQPAMGEDGQPQMADYIAAQHLCLEYVYWQDYRCSPARQWKDVWWEGFRLTMTEEEAVDNFGEVDGRAIPYEWAPKYGDKKSSDDDVKRAEVWEIWNKKKRERLYVIKGFGRVLKKTADPYRLKEFWPNAEPIRSVTTTDRYTPVPEFTLYEDMANSLDKIATRIDKLLDALKRRGVYDESIPELRRLALASDNQFIPVKNYASLAQKGGLGAAMQTEEIAPIAAVLVQLYEQRTMLVQAIYEVTGIADVMRGTSDPNETLGAQQIKANFGSMRLKRRQRAIQRWIRDTYRILSEIIAEHFEPQILQQMTGTQVSPKMVDILRSDAMRSYRVDIETDSTVFDDAEAEKKARVEVLTALGSFLKEAVPAAQAMPELSPLLFEMLSYGIRGFKAGRQLEDVIDQTKQAMEQKMQQPPPPKPGEQADQVKAQAVQIKAQGDIQTATIRANAEQNRANADMAQTAMDMEHAKLEHAHRMQQLQMDRFNPPQGGQPQ